MRSQHAVLVANIMLCKQEEERPAVKRRCDGYRRKRKKQGNEDERVFSKMID